MNINKSLYTKIYQIAWFYSQTATFGNELLLLKSLEKSQYYSIEKLQSLQYLKLVELLEYAYKNVPFYANRFKEIGMTPRDVKSLDDYNKIPILTRKNLQEYLPSLQSVETRAGKYKNHTGGSTGSPVAFYQDKLFHDYYKASIIRSRRWYGFERGDKVAYIWGAERDIPQWSITERIAALIKRQKWLNAFRMTEESMESYLRTLQKWRPRFIIGYASSLHAVAKYMLQHNVRDITPFAIESSAEKLWDHQREDIELAFNAPVINVYGSREMSPIASQCSERTGLHISAETRLVEITNTSGSPVEGKEVGQVVLTDLTNFTMPLIRYANGDLASWHNERCICGRTLPMLGHVYGRSSDLILTKSGIIMHGEFFTHLFYGQPIHQFQIRQVAIDKIVVLIRPTENFSTNILTLIKQRIDEFSDNAFEIDFQIVEEIPLTRSGKYRFTISELSGMNV